MVQPLKLSLVALPMAGLKAFFGPFAAAPSASSGVVPASTYAVAPAAANAASPVSVYAASPAAQY